MESIRPIMEQRVLQLPDYERKMARIKTIEIEKDERERLLVSLKTRPLPYVSPDLPRSKDYKCESCKVDNTAYTKLDDWYMEPIDAMMLKGKLFNGWFNWMKSIVLRQQVLPASLTSLAIHPAHIKMIKKLQKNNPDVTIAFVVATKAPQIDIPLINFALHVSDIEVSVVDVDKVLQEIPFVEFIRDEYQLKLHIKPKPAADQVEADKSDDLNTDKEDEAKNIVLLLDGDEEETLKRVLSIYGFGAKQKVFFMPVSINTEKIIQQSSKASNNLGIVKINFHEPYTVDDLLKRSSLDDDVMCKVEIISGHLLNDITMKRPIMSTNVVAFLLMTEFRDGTTVKDLADKLDSLCKIQCSFDFAFEGNAEDIVKHAVGILGERLVKYEKDSVTPNTSSIVELSSYAEAFLPHFALESILIISAQSLKRSENFVDFNELITTATDLCELLENQIKFLKPCENISSQLRRAFDSLSLKGILTKPVVAEMTVNEQRAQRLARQYESENEDSDDDGYYSKNNNNEVTINQEMVKEIEALKHVTMPIIDAYLTVAYCLKEIIGEKSYSDSDLLDCSMKMMREDLEDGNCKYWESCSRSWMKSCLKCFELFGIIIVDRSSDESLIKIHSDHNNKKSIKHFIHRIQRFLEMS